MSGHLGTDLAALVDGELGHAARERALVHLMRCDACHAEASALRRLKSRLREAGAWAPLPADDLAARLRGLAAAAEAAAPPAGPQRLGAQPWGVPALAPPDRAEPVAAALAGRLLAIPATGASAGTGSGDVLVASRRVVRPPSVPRARRAPAGRPARGRRVPRTALGGAVLVFGLGAVLALGAPPHRAPTRTPVDPMSDVQLIDRAGSAVLPLPDPVAESRAALLR